MTAIAKAIPTRAKLARIALALAAIAAPASAQIHAVAADAPAKLKESPAAPTLPDAAGVLTRTAAERFATAEFAFADADANAKLTEREFAALIVARQDALKAAEAGPVVNEATPAAAQDSETMPSAAADVGPGQTAEAPAAKTPAEIFGALAGAQKALAKKSFIAARLAQFDAADADKDGNLSEAEQAAFIAAVAGLG